ncbi:hypothetical protein BBO99_00008986 [Phytophthora kernoviae]|uniref:Uncharacterized protein n=2 Tax=Phytophthora kernoviae TaxID=325452 RepID=A0A3R7G3T6_9STRA|nr:hypothetical protein G195_010474 [Phytophthora kernoviae 00238/432]KAG2508604.1 hypothetical protein JM16_008803 [Phytophthora kernoviae]KAG2510784.1 hypothetical protein JM18_008836 [Phytophthora kernoviae]RLN25961.1 hypothetical protein BBI17_008994 [Phytophthora kernoviae]RLN74325.1 hypothetical protein BBO99_00008986 [Phytophthora kernoviae]
MASDPLSAVRQLQDVVEALAPTLRPQVLPKGSQYGLDLIMGLCKTEEQRQTLLALVQSSKPGATKAVKTQENDEGTDEEQDEGEYLEPQVVGAFDVEKRVFAVQKLQWMHERDAVVYEFARFLELQLENPKASQLVVGHFLEVNGHKKEETIKAQQCFSAAFALQTLLRAFPRPAIAIGGEVLEITSETDIVQAFAPLFAPAKKNTKTKVKAEKQAGGKKSKAKQQKSKKRKST